jgi:hypothetical protein
MGTKLSPGASQGPNTVLHTYYMTIGKTDFDLLESVISITIQSLARTRDQSCNLNVVTETRISQQHNADQSILYCVFKLSLSLMYSGYQLLFEFRPFLDAQALAITICGTRPLLSPILESKPGCYCTASSEMFSKS